MKLSVLKDITRLLENSDGAASQEQAFAQLAALGMDPDSFYQELEMTSRLVDTHRDVSYSNAHIQLHSHTFYELLYCTNTCGAEYLVGSERYRLQQGDIVFVPPGVSHRPLLPDVLSEPYKRYVLWLSQEFMELYAGLFSYEFAKEQGRSHILRTGGTRWESLRELFRTGVQEAERAADGWEAAVTGNTLILLTMIKRATEDRGTGAMQAEAPELLDRLVAYVEENYAASLTINDLAGIFFVSGSTISHLFKKKMGISFYRFVTQRRLIAAKSQIEKGAQLEDVAASVGFQDYSSFYRAFKQEYGISPRQYRNLPSAGGRTVFIH